MYIQCKVYIQICRKWRAFNRTIVVQVSSTCSLFNFVLISVIVWTGPPSGCYQKGAKEDIERKEAREGVPCLSVRS